MGLFSAIVGAFGGMAVVMGIITALKVVDMITPELTWMFWFVLAAILLLGSIALQSGRGE